MKTETKPLTKAEFAHLRDLHTERNRIIAQYDAEIQRFFIFLSIQHGVSMDDGWKNIDLDKGVFVREV